MKLHPIKLPLFAYATLKSEEKYRDTVGRFRNKLPTPAFTLGTLYYVTYTDESEALCVTVALDPVGCQQISGELLTFDDSVANQALAESDEKEFNFHDQSTSARKERLFIRTIVTCHTFSGETVLAWAYVYVSRDGHKPMVLVNQDTTTYGALTKYSEIDIYEYKKRWDNLQLIE